MIPDDVEKLRAGDVLRLVERERVLSIPTVGDAMARPLIDEIEAGDYDLSGLISITNGGAPMSPAVRDRICAALPNLLLMDAVGRRRPAADDTVATEQSGQSPVFPQADTTVVSADYSRVLTPADVDEVGWLARRDLIPLGYLGDEAKTAKTFPTIDGVRWSVPGDKARYLADGRIELLGRDSVTINSGGEKIFAEEVEQIAAHPNVYDVVVVGRPSERWGSEVVAVVQFAEGKSATDDELVDTCNRTSPATRCPRHSFTPTRWCAPGRQGGLPLGQIHCRGVRFGGKERVEPALRRSRLRRKPAACRRLAHRQHGQQRNHRCRNDIEGWRQRVSGVPTSQVTTYGVVPPNSATHRLYPTANPL